MAELTAAQEASVRAGIQAAYGVWLPAVQTAVLAGYNRFQAAPDPAAITSTASLWQQQVQELTQQQLQQVAQQQYEEEDGDGLVDMSTVLMAAALAATLYFLSSQVSEVAAQLFGITTVMSRREDAVRAIKEYLDPANPHWKAKSQQLAVSEGNRWAQAASLTAAVAVSRQRNALAQKIWVTRDDDRVRAAHATVDGQRRPLLAPFNVAGVPMMHPMDPAAPPSLVVNCRCWMRFERGSH